MRDFKVIWEDSDPQRLILLEDFGDCHSIVMFGDDYHNSILGRVEGFRDALVYLDITHTWSVAEIDDFGNDYEPKVTRNSKGGFSYERGNEVIELEFEEEEYNG